MTAPENRLALGRDNGGRFIKGVTGNPGGRPKGLAGYVREETSDGQYLVDKVLYILEHPKGKGIQAQRLQLECIQWLADRGFGKAVQGVMHAEVTTHTLDILRTYSDEDLEAMLVAGKAMQEKQRLASQASAEVIEGEARMLESDPDAGGAEAK